MKLIFWVSVIVWTFRTSNWRARIPSCSRGIWAKLHNLVELHTVHLALKCAGTPAYLCVTGT